MLAVAEVAGVAMIAEMTNKMRTLIFWAPCFFHTNQLISCERGSEFEHFH